MVGDGDGGRALVGGATRVVGGEDALHDERPTPRGADPLEVRPRDRRAGQRGGDVEERHRALARDHDVRKRPDPPSRRKPSSQPDARGSRARRGPSAAGRSRQLLHPVAMVALADSRPRPYRWSRRGRRTRRRGPRSMAASGGGAAADEVELVEHGPGGGGLHVPRAVARRWWRGCRPCPPGRRRGGRHFAPGCMRRL
jgi:hypothetical protein